MRTLCVTMDPERTILHVDMDAFFASVEQLDDPGLRGKPVLVGGSGRRGVVAAASYEARTFGCRSAMPMATALRLCPHAIVAKPRGRRYRALSDRVFEILERVTPVVEPLGIDEGFLDATGSLRLLGDGRTIAQKIKREIKDETGLIASVGVAPNTFLAKLASDMDKPDGLRVIAPGEASSLLAPMPVTSLPGVGRSAAHTLRALGVRTIGDLRRVPPGVLNSKLGTYGVRLAQLAVGEGGRTVTPDHEAKSVGHEQTFSEDLEDPTDVRSALSAHVEQASRRLRRKGRVARTVTVKIRFGDFETVTRSETLAEPSSDTDTLWAAAERLFDAWVSSGFRPVRLIGATLGSLSRAGTGQMGLFDREESAQTRRSTPSRTDSARAR
ncbi:MAG: DNA polymerase IV [Planctomycetota bacterium]